MLLSLSKSGTICALEIFEIALLAFGVLLVIGLIGEYRESWKRWVKIFEMFVIIGVAGELIADGGIFVSSYHLQTIADLEIAALNKEGGEARKVAAQAEERSGQANERAANADRIAEEERLERLKIQEKLADRRLTHEQRNAILGRIRSFPKQIVNFRIYASVPDAPNLANDIVAILTLAGWESHMFMGQETGRILRGVVIEYTPQSGEDTRKAATAIAKALGEQGCISILVPSTAMTSGMMGTGDIAKNAAITITVGIKP